MIYMSILLLSVGMSMMRLLKLSVLSLMCATLLVMQISQKKLSQRSKVPWIGSTPTEKFFKFLVFVQMDFPVERVYMYRVHIVE